MIVCGIKYNCRVTLYSYSQYVHVVTELVYHNRVLRMLVDYSSTNNPIKKIGAWGVFCTHFY